MLKRGGRILFFRENDNLRNFAYYVGYWAVFDHAVVYEVIGCSIREYILFEFKF